MYILKSGLVNSKYNNFESLIQILLLFLTLQYNVNNHNVPEFNRPSQTKQIRTEDGLVSNIESSSRSTNFNREMKRYYSISIRCSLQYNQKYVIQIDNNIQTQERKKAYFGFTVGVV